MTTVNKEQIFTQIKNALVELFELNEDEIKPDAHLYEDLDLDSIDAVDLVVHLQKVTGKKIQPDEFKTVRTVNDIVVAVEHLLESK
ncbi:acyl carrier protein [Vibrio mangrovi]|uniref:Acyl carrier protein n=1 Tax=Vibrio mangrovi TaxID=474394 RepID=A0A1Y6IR73_9VIBR|nr:acyl carrier protein [Vibrio mangrovi]MDW6001847.1 acyl carrier protein [Vibrio mangrovi]SMS00126.1 Acyl carrier protein [Vibrio mangrovi]